MERVRNLHGIIKFKLINTNNITFVLVLTIALFIVQFTFNFFYAFVEEKDIILYPFPRQDLNIILFLFVVIIAPVFETWLAQSLPYSLLTKVKYFREREYLILLISAIFFGLNHFYSLFYMIYGFLMGIVFMYGYMARIRTDNKTFYLIAICHSLINLGSFIKNLF